MCLAILIETYLNIRNAYSAYTECTIPNSRGLIYRNRQNTALPLCLKSVNLCVRKKVTVKNTKSENNLLNYLKLLTARNTRDFIYYAH